MVTHVNERDMRYAESLFRFTDPARIPCSFGYGDRLVRGIPEDLHPIVTRTVLSNDMVEYAVEGRFPDGLVVRAEQIVYRSFPVNEWIVYLRNEGSAPSPVIDSLCGLDGCLDLGECRLYHGNGDDSTENGYEWFLDPISPSFTLQSEGGMSCFGSFPYFRILSAEHLINVAVGWAGGWKTDFTQEGRFLHISVGQRRSHYRILPGETMRSPRVTLMGIDGTDTDRIRNMWRRWYFRYILPNERGGRPIGPKCAMHVFQAGGFPEFTGASEQNQVDGLRFFREKGLNPDIWWLDAGWYACDHDWGRIGCWEPDPERFPNGLTPIGLECEKQNTEFLLWFEPERVRLNGPRSPHHLAEIHPEWILCREGSGDGLLNLGNPDAWQYITDLVDSLIKRSHVHIYRQDFNFAPLDYWIAAEAPDRIGAMENLHIQGYLRYWDTLLARNPGLWIDSCASGGHRNDLDTMRRAVPLQYTDVGLGHHPVKLKQHRQMFEWIPYFRAHNYNWDNPKDGSYVGGGRAIDDYAYQVALTPALTDVATVHESEEVYECARRNQPLWRKAAELEIRGDYYPFTRCRKDPGDWYAMQFDDPERQEGFIQILTGTQTPDGTFTVYPFVHEDCVYTFTEDLTGPSGSATSQQLVHDGFTRNLPKRTGHVWFYRYEKES